MTGLSSMRSAFGAFLRARREALTPDAAGLYGTNGRRRAMGLRREEAAQLCGISTTWYTWLEQGREVACSAATLSRIAGALHFSEPERRYLFELAGLKDPRGNAHSRPAEISETLKRLTFTISGPAYVLSPLWDILYANPDAVSLFGEWIGQDCANLLHYVFMMPESRVFLADWEKSAQRVVAEFRAESVHFPGIRALDDLIERLTSASPDFERIWTAQTVLAREGGPRSFLHPLLGRVRYEQATLLAEGSAGCKLVVLLQVP